LYPICTGTRLGWSAARACLPQAVCDPLTPRSRQPCSPAFKLPRDQLSHGAGRAGLSPALSSPLSSLEIGQGLAALLPAGTPLTPLPARPGCRSCRGAGVNVGRRPSHSDAKRDLLRHRGVDDHQVVEGEGAVRLTDLFQRLLILAGLRRSQHPAHPHQHRT
jgi:hypothetical protein